MTLYPVGIFSIGLLGIAYAVMLLIYGFIWWLSGTMKARAVVRLLAALVILLVPVSEELWIAWNFNQACKEAGTYVAKQVHVDGFYDSTREMHAGPRNADAARELDRGRFHFYELALRDTKGGRHRVVHLEKAGGVWKATTLYLPTARYQYRSRSHIPIAWKVVEHESIVVDTKDQQVIGRERIVGRYAPWFWVGLDSPQVQCLGQRHTQGLIYQSVLLPLK